MQKLKISTLHRHLIKTLQLWLKFSNFESFGTQNYKKRKRTIKIVDSQLLEILLYAPRVEVSCSVSSFSHFHFLYEKSMNSRSVQLPYTGKAVTE